MIRWMQTSHLLTFDAFPERVRLDGFDEALLQSQKALLVRVSEEETAEAPYRVVATSRRGVMREGREKAAASRRPFVRFVPGPEEDLVLMPGGRVRLAPARAVATVEFWRPQADIAGFVVGTLVEAALIHALALRARAVVHAAALEVGGTSFLAVGPTRAGKSTLTAAALRAGGAVVSDDSVILGHDDSDRVVVGALRRNLWFREGTVDLVPEVLRSSLWEGVSFGERRWGLEREGSSELFRTRVRPGAVLLLRRDKRLRGMRVRQVSAAEALAGLIRATSPLFLSGRYPVERERLMPVLTHLVNETPCFMVQMGRTLVEDPEGTVEKLVAEIGCPAKKI